MEFIFTLSTVVLLVSYCLFYGFTLISNMCCANECSSSLYVLHFCLSFSRSLHVFSQKWMLIYLRALSTFYLLCYSSSYYVCVCVLLYSFHIIFVCGCCCSCSSFDLSLRWFMWFFFLCVLVYALLFYCLCMFLCCAFFVVGFSLNNLISLDLLPNG